MEGYGKRPPLDEQKSLWQATIAAEGVTTSAGEGTGLSLIDAGLAGAGANSFVSMMAVIHPGDPTRVDSRDVTAFNNGTGEVTVASAFKGGQVAAGVPYKIVTFRFVPAEVAALQADIGDASTSTLGSLYAILGNPEADIAHSVGHVPKYVGELLYVDGVNGDDGNSGAEPHIAKKTIGAAIAAATAGDRIIVKAGTYDEALNLNKDSLELICEQGTILANSTPGTVLIVSADYCLVVGPILAQAGQIGLQTTGNFNTIKDALAIGCSVGFDLGGAENHTDNCRSIQHTTTGFDVTGSYGIHRRLIAAGAGAVRGIYLSANTADRNHFHDCHTLGNTTAGWEVVAGADNNLFSGCSMAVDDGARVDNGTNNTWDDFSEGSQIAAGQSRDQDLKDIYDIVAAIAGVSGIFHEQPDTAVNINAIAASETDVLNLATANTRYIVRTLRLKAVDPSPNNITVRLYELVNDVATVVDTFTINGTNFGTYHSLMDMFGLPHLAGDNLRITVQASAGGPYAVTGQYSHAKNNI